ATRLMRLGLLDCGFWIADCAVCPKLGAHANVTAPKISAVCVATPRATRTQSAIRNPKSAIRNPRGVAAGRGRIAARGQRGALQYGLRDCPRQIRGDQKENSSTSRGRPLRRDRDLARTSEQ